MNVQKKAKFQSSVTCRTRVHFTSTSVLCQSFSFLWRTNTYPNTKKNQINRTNERTFVLFSTSIKTTVRILFLVRLMASVYTTVSVILIIHESKKNTYWFIYFCRFFLFFHLVDEIIVANIDKSSSLANMPNETAKKKNSFPSIEQKRFALEWMKDVVLTYS